MAHFIFKDFRYSSGIYVIFNSHNWRIYVGSCKNFYRRWKYGHLSSLLSSKHINRFLQADFNKCKEKLSHDDFLEFHILKNMPGSTRTQRLQEEEIWLKIHFDHGKRCYNLTDRAISREGFGSKNPEETSKKLSEALRRFYLDPENRKKQSMRLQGISKTKRSDEHRKRISLSKIGKKLSEETRLKMSEAGRTEAALERLRISYEKHKETTIEAQRKAVSKKHLLIHPNGTVIEVINLNKFCKENDMHSSCFSALLKKNKKTYKGWGYLGSCTV